MVNAPFSWVERVMSRFMTIGRQETQTGKIRPATTGNERSV